MPLTQHACTRHAWREMPAAPTEHTHLRVIALLAPACVRLLRGPARVRGGALSCRDGRHRSRRVRVVRIAVITLGIGRARMLPAATSWSGRRALAHLRLRAARPSVLQHRQLLRKLELLGRQPPRILRQWFPCRWCMSRDVWHREVGGGMGGMEVGGGGDDGAAAAARQSGAGKADTSEPQRRVLGWLRAA